MPIVHAFGLILAAVVGLAGGGSDVTAFVHANVVPMDSDRVLRDQTVVVSRRPHRRSGADGKDRRFRTGARVVDARGGYLSPGLADMHVHVYTPEELTLYAVNGVTTVFNLNGRPQYLEWRRRIADGELLGPAIYSTGPTFDRPRTPGGRRRRRSTRSPPRATTGSRSTTRSARRSTRR